MDRTGDITSPPSLLALGDADAAVCIDGFCEVPAPHAEEEQVPDAD
jgi:hypothetical protein